MSEVMIQQLGIERFICGTFMLRRYKRTTITFGPRIIRTYIEEGKDLSELIITRGIRFAKPL